MTPQKRRLGRMYGLVPAMLVVTVLLPIPPAAAAEGDASSLKELDPMPLVAGPGYAKNVVDRSGWLILDPTNRFAYQVFEQQNETVVQSFDLDTLKPRRRTVFTGLPIAAGSDQQVSPATTSGAGEIVHAVDEASGRLYLAMSDAIAAARTVSGSGSAEGVRPLTRFVMIDGKAFDRGDAAFAESFKEPATQAHLHNFNVVGMSIARHHVSAGTPGRLVVTFAHPGTGQFSGNDTTPVFAHTLAQWDVSSLRGRLNEERSTEAAVETQALEDATAEVRVLDVCNRSSMRSRQGGSDSNLEWEAMPTADAIYTVCQLAAGNGAVVEVPLAPGGRLTGGLTPRAFPLAKNVADVLVDPGHERLLLKVVEAGSNQGATVWVFDTSKARYTGAIALKQTFGIQQAIGLDPATGRLYALLPDHASGTFAVRGGLQTSDTRLDPAPPLENVRPDMAYPSVYRIRVDPATRRVFVRRGHGTIPGRAVYPGTNTAATPAPTEDFYRVFLDKTPVAEQPAAVDDAGFTTDVAESELTRASYLGSGSGFGARALLVGGLDAATAGAMDKREQGANRLEWPCGRDDREILAGSVGQVSISDLSTSAEAAALDADARTQRIAPDAIDACKPQPTAGGTTHRPAVPGDTEQGAFDQSTGADADGDGRVDRTEVNHYAAGCLGDPDKVTTSTQKGFAQPKSGREAFAARVVCDRPAEKAEGSATGALSLAATLNGTKLVPVSGDPVRVAHSSSVLTVTRKAGKGIEVKVDSIARGVEIAGTGPVAVGSIAVVRAEATSTATGRSGRAEGSFERHICGAVVAGRSFGTGCLNADQQRDFVAALNTALGTRGKARLRDPDPGLAKGSESGYRAAVQRDEDDLFEDRSVTKDSSAAVPGLEIMLFQGDGDTRWGAGRQIVQLAGVQASTSYGITCLYGQVGTGRCAEAGESTGDDGAGGTETVMVPGDTVTETITTPGGTVTVAGPAKAAKESRLRTILFAPGRALKEAVRLLFNNPRELALMAAVWALLYAPCYLGERRRSINGLRARRAAVGVG